MDAPDRRRGSRLDVEMLVERAKALNGRRHRSLFALNAIQARADRALRHGAQAVFRAQEMADRAARALVAVRERRLALGLSP